MKIEDLLHELKSGTRAFLDTETCGFVGIPVLLQYAVDDGPIHLYEIWKRPIGETIQLLIALAEKEIVFFNAGFDAFQLCKILTMLTTAVRVYGDSYLAELPENRIRELEQIEREAQNDKCWKPKAAQDLMLTSRKNKYQTLMNRGDVRIRRVPAPLAYVLADQLDELVEIPDIYFARFADKTRRWSVYDIEDDIHFKDVVLKFNPAAGLKFLSEHVLGKKPPFHFDDVACEHTPYEVPYAPTSYHARKLGGPDVQTWADVVHHHIEHWYSNENARVYAAYDIEITRDLWVAFDRPEAGDDDSELACMVAAVRWHGFSVDLLGIKELKDAAQAIVDSSPVNINNPSQVRAYMYEVMDVTEQIILADSTRKEIIQEIADTWQEDNPEAAERAKKILDVKFAFKEVELFDKILLAGKLHADLNVIGAVSSRMSGGGGLNVQGIKKTKVVRSKFKMAWDGMVLSGGDFSSYEITLADAVYEDVDLRKQIVSGVKLHGIFGTMLYPGKTYEEILASEGTDFDMYTKAKSGVFALVYGGNAFTLHTNLGIPIDVAEEAIRSWQRMFPGIGKALLRIMEQFSALRQGENRGITWEDPDDFVETKLGFRRYFTLENQVMKVLYELAQNPPKEWRNSKIKVVRREKIQTIGGAVQSALFGAAFALQNANIRAACNHEIQSLGATICKAVQRKIWDIQPAGYCDWRVAPLNIHDEVLCVTHPDYVEAVGEAMASSVEGFRYLVPLIGMSWQTHMESWAQKREGVGKTIKVTYNPAEFAA